MKMQSQEDIEKNFKPKGTIAFIILLLLLTVLIWFSVYNLQLEKVGS